MTDVQADPRPLRADAERNRLRILAAAEGAFAERGLGVSLDEIAHAAGVGVGTVYRRFPDKETLIDALFESKIDAVVAHFEACLELEDPWEAFARMLRGGCEMQARDRGLKEALLGQDRGLERVREARERIAPLARGIVSHAIESGAVRPDLEPFDVPLINLAIGLVAERTRDVAPEVWTRIVTIILDGLRAERTELTPMPVPGLDPEQFAEAMRRRAG